MHVVMQRVPAVDLAVAAIEKLTEARAQIHFYKRVHRLQALAVESDADRRTALLLAGNEARGVPHDELAKLDVTAYSIQGAGVLESLNLATAVNMCAYELNR